MLTSSSTSVIVHSVIPSVLLVVIIHRLLLRDEIERIVKRVSLQGGIQIRLLVLIVVAVGSIASVGVVIITVVVVVI